MNDHINRSEGRRTEDATVRDANAMLRTANIRLREANVAMLKMLEKFTQAKWTDAPKGAGMMVAHVELAKEKTLTMYVHKDTLPLLGQAK